MKTKSIYVYVAFFIIFVAACFLWMLRNDTFTEKATHIQYRDKDIERRLGITLEEYVKKNQSLIYNLMEMKEITTVF